MRSMDCTIHNGPVYETIQQKPEVFTQQSLSQVTTLGDQIMEKNNQEQERVQIHACADWKRERPILEVYGTSITMNSVGTLNTSVNI